QMLPSHVGVIEDAEFGGRDVDVTHQFLGEDLARLEPGRLTRRTEDAQILFLEFVDNSQRQRLLRTDDRQADALLSDKLDQLVNVVGLDGDIDAVLSGAGVAGSAVNAVRPWRLDELPDQGVFAPALADDQDLHSPSPPLDDLRGHLFFSRAAWLPRRGNRRAC